MTSPKKIVAFCILSLIVAGLFVLRNQLRIDAPDSVKEEYFGFITSSPYRHVSMRRCYKEAETIYIVNESSGFNSSENYFASDGNKVGEYLTSDIKPYKEEEAPVKRSDYACDKISEVEMQGRSDFLR